MIYNYYTVSNPKIAINGGKWFVYGALGAPHTNHTLHDQKGGGS
jgi:hypothetical protein